MKNTKDFVATVFPVKENKVLLIWHKKLQMWLPPGGHIDSGELPDECAVREVLEETGLKVELMSSSGIIFKDGKCKVRMLATPDHVQLEDISPGHQHIDLYYIGKVVGGAERCNSGEAEQMRWFSTEELDSREITDNIRYFGKTAIRRVKEGLRKWRSVYSVR